MGDLSNEAPVIPGNMRDHWFRGIYRFATDVISRGSSVWDFSLWDFAVRNLNGTDLMVVRPGMQSNRYMEPMLYLNLAKTEPQFVTITRLALMTAEV